MNIEIKSIGEAGSCSFCQRGVGELSSTAPTQYPYAHVYEIVGNSISVRMCEDCMIEFTERMLALPVISEVRTEVPE